MAVRDGLQTGAAHWAVANVTPREARNARVSAAAWNASPVAQLDTSALAVLLECARMASGAKRKLEIVNAPARMSDLAHLYGVDGLLGVAAAPFEPAANVGESKPAEIPTVPILR